jgi:glycosyltransferase involved in cell wall biosynthesis
VKNNKILIICDNPRIGGIQRLAQDQYYWLTRNDFSVFLCFMSSSQKENTFLNRETEMISVSNENIKFMGEKRIVTILNLIQFIRKEQLSLIISHSLRATVVSFLVSKFFTTNDIRVKTCIHQLPALSAPVQRIRRYVYSQFSHDLFGYSRAVVEEWNKRFEKKWLFSLFAKRLRIKLLRNGVYLNRIPFKVEAPLQKRELCFVGRLTNWKGIDTFLEMARHSNFKDYNIKIAVPEMNLEVIEKLEKEFGTRLKLNLGKTFSELDIGRHSVLAYPVNYGVSGEIESISINVLESLAAGAKCVITKGGSGTWPDLLATGLLLEFDWSNLNNEIADSLDFFRKPSDCNLVIEAREIIDIRNNCAGLTS